MRIEANCAKAAQSNARSAATAILATVSGLLLLKYNYH
jgi:hypothetical protein